MQESALVLAIAAALLLVFAIALCAKSRRKVSQSSLGVLDHEERANAVPSERGFKQNPMFQDSTRRPRQTTDSQLLITAETKRMNSYNSPPPALPVAPPPPDRPSKLPSFSSPPVPFRPESSFGEGSAYTLLTSSDPNSKGEGMGIKSSVTLIDYLNIPAIPPRSSNESLYDATEYVIPVMGHDNNYYQDPPEDQDALYSVVTNRNGLEIDRKNLIMGDNIGAGAFGSVFSAKLLLRGQSQGIVEIPVAVKSLSSSSSSSSSANNTAEIEKNKIAFLQEAAIMKQFSHLNVVSMVGIVTITSPMLIVLEFMSRGSLQKLLRSDKLNDNQKLKSAIDIAKGMNYLGTMRFVHRDIASRNILVDVDFSCKIADFGLARAMLNGKENDYYKATSNCIPLRWTSLEAINFHRFSHQSDIWSYGIVLYEMYSEGRLPYIQLGNNDVVVLLEKGMRLQKPDKCSEFMYNIMLLCWHPEPSSRPPLALIANRLELIQKNQTQNDNTPSSFSTTISQSDYLHTNVTRQQAEDKMKEYLDVDGSFLVRSREQKNTFALSIVKDFDVYHHLINIDNTRCFINGIYLPSCARLDDIIRMLFGPVPFEWKQALTVPIPPEDDMVYASRPKKL